MRKSRNLVNSMIGLTRPKLGRKAGLAPATVAYVGENRDFQPWFDVFDYSEQGFTETAKLTDQKVLAETPGSRWLHITGIHNTTLIGDLCGRFGIHPLVQEDIVHTSQRPKLEEYPDFSYLVLKMITFDEATASLKSEQLSVVIKGNTLMTFIEDPGDLFDPIRERIRKGNQKLCSAGPGYLLYSILDTLVDQYFVVLEKIGDKLEMLEMKLLSNPQQSDLRELHHAKRELIYLRKFIWPLREVVGQLSKEGVAGTNGNVSVYLRDVYDHSIQVIETLETYRDISSSMMDIYLSSLSNKMNMVMKTLTIIATIFIPLTFVVGVYGMNFDYMPELHHPYGYGLTWLGMILIALGMLLWFRRKNWW